MNQPWVYTKVLGGFQIFCCAGVSYFPGNFSSPALLYVNKICWPFEMFNVTRTVSSMSSHWTLSGGCWHSRYLRRLAGYGRVQQGLKILGVSLTVMGSCIGAIRVSCESLSLLWVLVRWHTGRQQVRGRAGLQPAWCWSRRGVGHGALSGDDGGPSPSLNGSRRGTGVFGTWTSLESPWIEILNSPKCDLDAVPASLELTSEDFGWILLERDHGLVSSAALQSAFNGT